MFTASQPRREVAMEGRLWERILDLLPEPAALGRRVYDDRIILMIVLYATLHDRLISWACQPDNWATPPKVGLPDPSTVSRRRREHAFEQALNGVLEQSRGLLGPPARDAAIDSRPMVVGGATKDPDAPAGRGVGGFARGYRAHMLIDTAGVVHALRVAPINVNDRVAARELLDDAPPGIERIAGDANYDSIALLDRAASRGIKLYTPLRQNRVGRRAQPRRRRLWRLMNRRIGASIANARGGIERVFARMSNFACGLKPLPAWVRRLTRVTQWITAEVIIYHAYLLTKTE
ncbi:MAG: IS4/IS5 family transposase [Planctomycetota bacterium]|nr:MAG: IS4/IS5 family transposase [Planctomycetota bacterium]